MKSEFLVNVDHCCVLSLMSKAQKIDQKLIVGEGDHTQPSPQSRGVVSGHVTNWNASINLCDFSSETAVTASAYFQLFSPPSDLLYFPSLIFDMSRVPVLSTFIRVWKVLDNKKFKKGCPAATFFCTRRRSNRIRLARKGTGPRQQVTTQRSDLTSQQSSQVVCHYLDCTIAHSLPLFHIHTHTECILLW